MGSCGLQTPDRERGAAVDVMTHDNTGTRKSTSAPRVPDGLRLAGPVHVAGHG